MRIINLRGRLAVDVSADGQAIAVDVAKASAGRFGPDPQSVYAVWDEFADWAASLAPEAKGAEPFDAAELGAPVPRPAQVFAIGLNYREHALEAGSGLLERPMVFTKFPAAITGPAGTIELPPGDNDWEIELVAVIGRRADHVSAEHAWSHIAGLTAGQDLSERRSQVAGPAPAQYSLAKSFRGFAPIGPAVVTPGEFTDPGDLALKCTLNGETVQEGRSGDMIFGLAGLVAHLSAVLPLLPGDLIFTGTPPGIGAARTPPRFLRVGDVLVSSIDGIGHMRHEFTDATRKENQ
jgi:2-keto-4-pentenoate hydratase/2-oxohepta-3-ene-1,7-dioic acid hydratase in catechol pathway